MSTYAHFFELTSLSKTSPSLPLTLARERLGRYVRELLDGSLLVRRSLTDPFADLPDPRVARTRKHRLDDILMIHFSANRSIK